MSAGWGCLTYLQWNPFIGWSSHSGMVPIPAPPFFAPIPMPHIAFSVVNGVWLGSSPSTGNSREVMYNGIHYMGRLSDAGLIVPHVSIPIPYQALLPWTILFGGSMALWGSSSVVMSCNNIIFGDTTLDTACTPFGPVPLSLNLACSSPISLPADLVVLWGTSKVGFTFGDFVAGLIDMAIQIAVDVISHAGYFIKKFRGASKGFDKICSKVSSKLKVVKTAVKSGWDAFSTKASALWKGAKEAMQSKWSSMKTRMSKVWKALTGKLDDEALDAGRRGSMAVLDESGERLDDILYRNADDLLEEVSESAWKKFKNNASELLSVLKKKMLGEEPWLTKFGQFVLASKRKWFTYARKAGGFVKDIIVLGGSGTDDQFKALFFTLGDRQPVIDAMNSFVEEMDESDSMDRFQWTTG